MPYYPQMNLLFIHIPKTGGTSIEEYLNKHSEQTVFSPVNHGVLPGNLGIISLQHQTYETIVKYHTFLGVPSHCRIISIVRNPYDRILSELLFIYRHGGGGVSENSTPAEVYVAMKAHIDAGPLSNDNHTLPQYKFILGSNGKIASQITLFQTERLTEEFRKYGFKDYTGSSSSENYRKYLNADSISLINEYYGKDFDMFDYTRLDPGDSFSWNIEKVALMCRIKNERFIREFVNYYLAEGVNHIYLFDDMSTLYLETLNILHASNLPVTIIREKLLPSVNHPSIIYQVYQKYIYSNYDWVINVDADEYIVPCKNKKSTICQELMTTFRGADCIYVPWVMMGFQGREKDPESLLMELDHRWNHDKRHPNKVKNHKFRCRYNSIEYKSIWRPSAFREWGLHTPEKPLASPLYMDSVHNTLVEGPVVDTAYHLSELDIHIGHLLCYHYRTTSKEHARRKTLHQSQELYQKENAYEGILSNDFNEVQDDTVKKRVLAQIKRSVKATQEKIAESKKQSQEIKESQQKALLYRYERMRQIEKERRWSSMPVVSAERNKVISKNKNKNKKITILQNTKKVKPQINKQPHITSNPTTSRQSINYPIL